MTPTQLSGILRHIAAKIDNSVQPSRSAVATELQGVLYRVANRYFTITAISHAFNNLGMRPPDSSQINQIGKDIYEVKLEPGWVLTVDDSKPTIEASLNGKLVGSIEDAVRAYKSKNSKYGITPTQNQPPKGTDDQSIVDALDLLADKEMRNIKRKEHDDLLEEHFKTKRCQNCGISVPGNFKKCYGCGANLL